MMKVLMLASSALIATPALAADAIDDVPSIPGPEIVDTWNWSGFYAGVQAGYGFGNTGQLALTPFTFAGLITAFTPAGAPPGSSYTGAGDFDDSFVGGAYIGYDWQFNNLVVGAVFDVVGTDLSDRQFAVSRTPATYTIERSIDLLATARVRAGAVVSNRFLPYITGGLAYGEVDFRYSQPGSAATFTTSGGQDSDFGYTVGAGVETRLTQKISLGFEYLYTNLGDNDFQANLTGGPFGGPGGLPGSNPTGTTLTGSDDDFDFHTIQFKLSYRF